MNTKTYDEMFKLAIGAGADLPDGVYMILKAPGKLPTGSFNVIEPNILGGMKTYADTLNASKRVLAAEENFKEKP
jgi:hypothetical protein